MSAPVNRPDPVEAEIERALDPGRFVSDRGCFRFVDGLERVAATIGRLVADDAERAATLYETFLAGCNEKAEEVDDSSGSFGLFAQSLISGWVAVRQGAHASPQQTTARLLAWMDGDQYGFCHRLEHEIATARTSDSSWESVGHHAAEQAATALEPGYPGEAARIWRAAGKRILEAGKSKYYGSALRYFAYAKRCYQQAGQPDQWQEVVHEVYAQHGRKTSFLPGFDALLTGTHMGDGCRLAARRLAGGQ